jgi:hypothetical protein
MELSEIFNFVLGGSLLATVIGIVTLRATVRKANAEAEKAKADAETVRIDNAEHATRILVDNIVEPLKEELNGTRKDLMATKREMARLRKAIDTANSCKHHDDCPVLRGVREHPKDSAGDVPDGNGAEPGGQHEERSPPGTDGNGAEIGGESEDTG